MTPVHRSRPRARFNALAIFAVAAIVAACGSSTTAILSTIGSPYASGTPQPGGSPSGSPSGSPTGSLASGGQVWRDATLPVEQRVSALLAAMTLDEKIGQMTQIEVNSTDPAGVTQYMLGSVLSGGDGNPKGDNTAENWYKMVAALQQGALQTRLAIPILYGVDAIHGDAHLTGTTIFPQNVGMGATHDPDLVKKACSVTAAEMYATGVRWTFGPTIAVPQDIRWGRTYEGYGERTDLVSQLGTACLQGFQGDKLTDPNTVVADPKHYIGDGGTEFGSSHAQGPSGPYLLDQGVDNMDDATIEKLFLPPYQKAVESGARIIMASFSGTRDGGKVHGDKHWLTDVLKTQLRFTGFVVSDWGGIDQVAGDYSSAVKKAINAGIDMAMVPQDAAKFEDTLRALVERGDVPQSRIDDAVTRILRVKFEMGLFENPMPPSDQWNTIGSDANRAVARQAVAESAVVLKTSVGVLPVAKTANKVLLAGTGADDIGIAAGGWTLTWQGQPGNVTKGTTIRQGLAAQLGDRLQYSKDGHFQVQGSRKAAVGIVVVAERPYSEGVGDSSDLQLPAEDLAVVGKVRPLVQKLIVLIVSGRPVMLSGIVDKADAVVEVWQFGTEGEGVADVLLGGRPFTGTTPYTWPKTPSDAPRTGKAACAGAVFPAGYGLDAAGKLLGPAACR